MNTAPNLNPKKAKTPITLLNAPTNGKTIDVAEKSAVYDPIIKLTLKKLAIFIRMLNKRTDTPVFDIVFELFVIIKIPNRKDGETYLLKILPKQGLIN